MLKITFFTSGSSAGASSAASETTTYILPGLQFRGNIERGGRFVFATTERTNLFDAGVHELAYQPLKTAARTLIKAAEPSDPLILNFIDTFENYIKSRSTDAERGKIFAPSASTRFDKLAIAVETHQFLKGLVLKRQPLSTDGNLKKFKSFMSSAESVESGFAAGHPGGALGRIFIDIRSRIDPAYKKAYHDDRRAARLTGRAAAR